MIVSRVCEVTCCCCLWLGPGHGGYGGRSPCLSILDGDHERRVSGGMTEGTRRDERENSQSWHEWNSCGSTYRHVPRQRALVVLWNAAENVVNITHVTETIQKSNFSLISCNLLGEGLFQFGRDDIFHVPLWPQTDSESVRVSIMLFLFVTLLKPQTWRKINGPYRRCVPVVFDPPSCWQWFCGTLTDP